MDFGTENHGLNLQFTSGLFKQVEWPIHCMLYYSGPGVTGLLKQMFCICKWSFGQVPLYL